MKLSDLKNKRICLLGLGLENFSLAKYLVGNGMKPSILDRRQTRELGERCFELKKLGCDFCLGTGYLNDIQNFEVIFRSPGFLPNASFLRGLKNNSQVISPAELFFSLCPAKTIAITGTKGKGTVSSLIFHILKFAFQSGFFLPVKAALKPAERLRAKLFDIR